MKRGYKILLILAILSIVIFLIYFNKGEKVESVTEAEVKLQENLPQEIFSPGLYKIMIDVGTQNLYTDNPETTLTYYAVDNLNKPVHFRGGDRAFVRILGVTRLFASNTEIFHPGSDGSKDYTLFLGNISIPYPGTYLVKVCLGKSINLDSEGTMVWPFGCFEDQTSVQMNVYERK